VKDEINWWGGRLKEAFEQLEVGEVIEKGTESGGSGIARERENGPRNKEMDDLHDHFRRKKQQSTDMKKWLKKHGYSWEEKDRPHRVILTLRWGQEEVVVVEGHSAPDMVGYHRRASQGLAFSSAILAISSRV